MRYKWPILFLLTLIFVSSCREETYEPPFIQMFSPSENGMAQTGDTLQVKGSISSAIPITYIKIVLLTSTYIQSCPAITIYPNSTNYNLNTEYIISNNNLLSGTHYLFVEAGNDYASGSRFIKLTISGIPKESKALFAFCHETANDHVKIFKVDSLLNYTLFKQLPDDFQEGAVNSQDQLIYSMGLFEGNLYSLDATDGNILHQVNAIINPPFPYFESLYWGNNLLVVGYYDGRIEGYFGNGNLKFVYSVENFRLHKVSFDGLYLLSVLEYYTVTEYCAGAIYEFSGLLKDMIFVNYEIVNFYRASGNDVVLFCNDALQPSVKAFNTYTMVITHIKNLPAGTIQSVTQIDDDKFLICHSNGFLLYSFDNNSYAETGSGSTSGEIVYDETDNIIYLSEGKNISAYSYPTLQHIGTVVLSDSIKDLEILYNR